MWQYCLFVSALMVTTVCGQVLLTDYTISPSNQISYYHYPAPPKSQQIISPPPQYRQYQQPAQQAYQNQYQPQQQQQYQYQHQQQQQHHQQQHQHHHQQPRAFPSNHQQPQYSNNYYRPGPQLTPNAFPAAAVSQRFASPALENAAFTMALTNQGYSHLGNTPAASTKTSLTSFAAAPPIPTTLATTPAELALLSASPATSANSLNVKLPLPFNITPLNIAPLPLQAGTPYSSLPKGVTSYGTVYPQRRRR